MRHVWMAGLCLLALGGHAARAQVACGALAAAGLPGVTVDQAETVAAGTVRRFGAGNLPSGTAAAEGSFLPAHCLVRGRIDARPSPIAGNTLGTGFELRLPAAWNGRFFFQGGGGFDGWLRQASGVIVSGTAADTGALSRGFAVVTTDAGHRSDDPSPATDGRFAQDPKARIDDAETAVVDTTRVAKQLIARFYGRPIERSYFVGCSNGGREGMVEAVRHPEDFDGIVSGDPAFDLSRAVIGWDWNERELAAVAPRDAEGNPDIARALTDDDLALLSRAVLAKCDAADGLRDGIIGVNPGVCSFDPETLLCRGDATVDCLSVGKIRAIKAIYAGAHDAAGRPLYVPWTEGGEAGPAGWRAWILGDGRIPGRQLAFVRDWMRFIAVEPGQAPIDWQRFDFEADPARAAPPATAWQATSTDDGRFLARGGKLLIYQGTADPAFSANDIIGWFRRLDAPPDGSRLFLVPGMAHCAGGMALDRFDPLTAIVDWVEKGQAPDRMIATGSAFPGRSRPLCPYPSIARYDGHGNPEDAASFSCAP